MSLLSFGTIFIILPSIVWGQQSLQKKKNNKKKTHKKTKTTLI